jgi:superfamily II DNA/RNA helicase
MLPTFRTSDRILLQMILALTIAMNRRPSMGWAMSITRTYSRIPHSMSTFISSDTGKCLSFPPKIHRTPLPSRSFTSLKSSNSIVQDPSDSQQGVLSWTKLGLIQELASNVYDEQRLITPTPVQQMVIPTLLQNPPESLAFLGATGSGKTLAYTLPLLQRIKSNEWFASATTNTTKSNKIAESALNSMDVSINSKIKPKRPKVIILAPTRELALQITSVVKQLSHSIKLSSQALVGSEDYGKQRKALNRPIDIVVATPSRLLQH